MSQEPRRLSPFAAYIRERRRQLRLSQEEVARRAGKEFQAGYIAKLERDAVGTPAASRVRKLARALDVSAAHLGCLIFGESGDAPPALPEPPALPPPVIDPALPAYVQAALRPLVGRIPDEDVRAAGRMLAAMELKSREELDAEHGPTAYQPPSRGRADRDSETRDDAPHNGTAG